MTRITEYAAGEWRGGGTTSSLIGGDISAGIYRIKRSHWQRWGMEGIPGRGHSKCKGPEVRKLDII